MEKISLLHPTGHGDDYTQLSDVAVHNLGYEVDKINATETDNRARASSLIVRSDAGKRSFKVQPAPPEGMSYAEDVARKYGVTYELLTENMTLRN